MSEGKKPIVVGTYNLLGIEPLTRAAAESLLY